MSEPLFRILVVDDDVSMREVCAEILGAMGYMVTAVPDGWKALAIIDKGWDLVVSDFNMPGLDGHAFLKAAEERVPGISSRFVFMTGSRGSAASVAAMNHRLINKPFKVKDFITVVEGSLNDYEADRRDRRIRLEGCQLYISFAGTVLAAFAEDLSHKGMKIRYSGRPIDAGPGLRILIDGLNISREARVVWSSASAGSESFSGITFEKPVPVSVISGLLPGSL